MKNCKSSAGDVGGLLYLVHYPDLVVPVNKFKTHKMEDAVDAATSMNQSANTL
jgi:hypothetical protein